MTSSLVHWFDRQSWVHALIRNLKIRALVSYLLSIFPLHRTYAHNTKVEVADLESFFLIDEIFQRQTYRQALSLAGEIKTVVDLGCNVGFFCCYLRTFFGRHDFRGLCVDANPKLTKRAIQNLKLNDLAGIKLIQGMVGETKEKTSHDFFVYASHLGSSQFVEPEKGKTIKGSWTKINVPVLKVSEIWQHENGETLIDLLKIDIEGSEGKLLQTDLALFQQTKSIVLEWHKWLVKQEELFPILQQIGFTHQQLLETGKSTELWFFSRG